MRILVLVLMIGVLSYLDKIDVAGFFESWKRSNDIYIKEFPTKMGKCSMDL